MVKELQPPLNVLAKFDHLSTDSDKYTSVLEFIPVSTDSILFLLCCKLVSVWFQQNEFLTSGSASILIEP